VFRLAPGKGIWSVVAVVKSKLLLFKLIALVLLFGSAVAPAAEAKKPNILVIVADDLGYGELSIQGNPQIPTPNIDSLAKSGIRFTSGYVSGPYCSPTRAGLMTGRYQQRFGHEFNPGPTQESSTVFGLSLKETTLGNRLKDAGYVTGWFGKSHLGYLPQFHPLKRGFDEYFGFLGGAHDYLDAASDSHNPILRGTNVVNNIGYTTDAFGREAIKFIEKHHAEPWFVYLAFNAVHAPLESIEKYLSRFPNIEERKRHTFAAMLSAMDDAVGAVVAKVRQYGQEENTLIFFISDNGGPTAQTTSGNGPLRGFKAQTWEGGIRIPYIIQWKGHLPAGKVDDRPVIQLDIFPTALAAAGVSIRPEWKLDGVNLLPYVTGSRTDPPHSALYWRFGGQMAIRQGDWKLVKAPGLAAGARALSGKASTDDAELYNLARDIGEKTNLAMKEPAKVKELAKAWSAWNAELVEPAWRPGGQGTKKGGTRAGLASNAPADGPWKSEDSLRGADAPQIANRAFSISAEIEPASENGVIVAQGGASHGFTFFVQDRKLAFGVRVAKKLTVVTASEPLGNGRCKVQAQLAANGVVTLLLNGREVGRGRVSGLIANQPTRGLLVGGDTGTVGDYPAPNTLIGKIEQVRLRFL
jgi:arylsulfatase A-like enzyme